MDLRDHDQLEGATESLRIAWRDLRYDLSHLLHAEAPDLVAAITHLIDIGATTHVPAPVLTEDEVQPETISDVHLFVDDGFDTTAPRHLRDVWEGRGDYNDAFTPQETRADLSNLPAVEHDHELLAKRMREDSDVNLK